MSAAAKTISVGGLTWNIISANERSTSHGGRHFFAYRCNPKSGWRIDETNQAEVNGSRNLRVIGLAMGTKELSSHIKKAVARGAA